MKLLRYGSVHDVYARPGMGHADKNPDWYPPYIQARLGGTFVREINVLNSF